MACFLLSNSTIQAELKAFPRAKYADFIKGIENRFEGSAGNDKCVEKLKGIFKKNQLNWGKVSYEQPVFKPGEAWLKVGGQKSRLYTLYPNLVDLCHFESDKVEGKIHYLGRGRLEDTKNLDLKGAIALLDFDCVKNYADLMTLGLRGFIFIEPEKTDIEKAQEKIIFNTVTIPRYQIDRKSGLALKAKLLKGALDFQVDSKRNRWHKRLLENLWCYIPGSDPKVADEYLIIKSNIDNFHYCPELVSGGADSINLFLAVQMLEKYAKAPPPYPILFHFSNSAYQFHSGSAHLVHYTLAPESIIFDNTTREKNEERKYLNIIKEAKYLIGEYDKLSPQNITQANIDEIIEKVGRPTGRNLPVLKPLKRMLDFDINQLEERSMQIIRSGENRPEEFSGIKAEMSRIGKIVELLKKYGSGSLLEDLSQESRVDLESYRSRVLKIQRNRIERAEVLHKRLDEIRVLRNQLGSKKPLLAIDFDYTFGNSKVGLFMTTNALQRLQLHGKSKKNSAFEDRVGLKVKDAIGKDLKHWKWIKDAANDIPHQKITDNIFYFRGLCPAFALTNAHDRNMSQWTSSDTLDNFSKFHLDQCANIAAAVIDNIVNAFDHDKFLQYRKTKSPQPSSGATAGFWRTRIIDRTSITEPETVLSDGLVVIWNPNYLSREDIKLTQRPHKNGGILPFRLYQTDTTGLGVFHNLRLGSSYSPRLYHMNQKGDIDMALDFNSYTKGRSYTLSEKNLFLFEGHLLAAAKVDKADIYQIVEPMRLSDKFNTFQLQGAKDSRLISFSASGFNLLGVPPRFYNSLHPGALFLPHGERAKLVFTKGFLAGVKNLKRNDDNGFTAAELHRKSLMTLMNDDVNTLNRARAEVLTRNAVTNGLIEALLEKNEDLKAKEEKSTTKSHYQDAANDQRSLGNGYVAYPVVKGTLNDMIYAVVFYLVVMLPFCFFIQKLLFNISNIEAQLLTFTGLFFGTYMIFHLIHPAFKIAQNPQIIIISFVTIILVLFASSILRGKFDYHMKDFGGKFLSEDSNTMKLAGKAFIIGVTNMRRRKVRTSLTCVTIIFITFTMLSFTSVSQSVSPTLVQKEGAAPYNGVFYSHVIWKGIPQHMSDAFLRLIDGGDVVKRSSYDTIHSYSTYSRIFLEWTEKDITYELKSISGLQKKEDGFLAKIPMAAGRFFSSDHAEEIILTRKLAEGEVFNIDLSKEKPGQELSQDITLRLGGRDLKLVGIVDGKAMSKIKDLRGASIIPQILAIGGSATQLVAGDEEVPEGSFRDCDLDSFAIVPHSLTGLGLNDVSVSVKFDEQNTTWQQVKEIVMTSDLRVYFGCTEKFAIDPTAEKPIYENPGQYYLKTGMSTSIGGLSALLIPLLVSATIIFNTMLSAVYERKKEIAIYNSIGLSPVHVGLFFIAEAVVYGVIGSVSGYLFGQIFAKTITTFGWFSELNINYSSTSVVYVILFTILIVVFSSLYPAYVALRTATASSGQTKLKIKDSNELSIVFPFSYDPRMVIAVHTYLRDYMDLHVDQSVGGFMSSNTGAEVKKEEKQIVQEFSVSLAPFDLGVLENVAIRSFYNEKVGAYMLEATATRIAGTDSNWLATHRPFSNGIRKYLLKWRALKREEQEEYYERGQKIFNTSAPVNA